MGSNTLGKERMEALLNAELMTGDDAAAIEGFFQRHGIPYSFDESIRRYSGTAQMGDHAPLSVYIYTDTDRKMTVTLVQTPRPESAMRRTQRAQNYLDLPGVSVSRRPY